MYDADLTVSAPFVAVLLMVTTKTSKNESQVAAFVPRSGKEKRLI